MKPGDELVVGSDRRPARARNGRADRRARRSSSRSRSSAIRPPPHPAALALALPRPPSLRKVLQQATALGVKRFLLFASARVEKSYWQSSGLRPEALREQLLLGLEQAGDCALPEIGFARRFRDFAERELPALARGAPILVAHPGAPPLARGRCGPSLRAGRRARGRLRAARARRRSPPPARARVGLGPRASARRDRRRRAAARGLVDTPRGRPDTRAAHGSDGEIGRARAEPRAHLSVERDLRRHRRLLGLRADRRRAARQREGAVVADAWCATATTSSGSTRRSSRTRRPGMASGHVANFHDPMVDCRLCKRRFRADQIDADDRCPASEHGKHDLHRAAPVQPDAEDADRRAARTRPATRICAPRRASRSSSTSSA